MKMCNDTITVFNRRLDPDTGYEIYTPTVIRGVSWYSHVDSAVTSDGLKAANKITIRIPIDADKYGEIATILGVTDNRRAPRAKHWKVVGG